MYKEDKFKKERKQVISRGLVDSNLKEDKYLKNLQNTRDFDYDKYNKGQLWYESGLSLESAPLELRKDVSFIKGYNRGQRLAFIKQMDSNSKKR